MGLNIQKGNMYEFVTHTWNTVKGECPHGCSYCYCKRWGKQSLLHFDARELKTDLGNGNFIFIGSSCDMWARGIPESWINETLKKCWDYRGNKYLFQSKNPLRFREFEPMLPYKATICTTLETNRWYPEIMQNSPEPIARALDFSEISKSIPRFITIEPILDFDLVRFAEMIARCEPNQVNIGADSGHNNLPEPPREKIEELIERLSGFTKVVRKKNLARLKEHHSSLEKELNERQIMLEYDQWRDRTEKAEGFIKRNSFIAK